MRRVRDAWTMVGAVERALTVMGKPPSDLTSAARRAVGRGNRPIPVNRGSSRCNRGVHFAWRMSVPSTQLTLLARLQNPKDEAAWKRFESRYRELLVRFCMRHGLQPTDAEDVAQSSFTALLNAMPAFRLDPAKGRFRDYLFRVVRSEISRVRAKDLRPTGAARTLSISEDSVGETSPHRDTGVDPSQTAFEQEWINHHFRIAMAKVRRTFAPESVAIFERLMRGDPVAAIATDSGMSEQAVHKIKQRVRDRMKSFVEQQIAEEG